MLLHGYFCCLGSCKKWYFLSQSYSKRISSCQKILWIGISFPFLAWEKMWNVLITYSNLAPLFQEKSHSLGIRSNVLWLRSTPWKQSKASSPPAQQICYVTLWFGYYMIQMLSSTDTFFSYFCSTHATIVERFSSCLFFSFCIFGMFFSCFNSFVSSSFNISKLYSFLGMSAYDIVPWLDHAHCCKNYV